MPWFVFSFLFQNGCYSTRLTTFKFSHFLKAFLHPLWRFQYIHKGRWSKGLLSHSRGLHSPIGQLDTLPKVEGVQALHVGSEPCDALVRDVTGGHGEGGEGGQTCGHVGHRTVRDTITERDVKSSEAASAALGEETNTDITDVITGAEVEVSEARKARQRLPGKEREWGWVSVGGAWPRSFFRLSAGSRSLASGNTPGRGRL